MRYQKLEIQEASWKWAYLLKKYREGENVTKHTEASLIEQKMQLLTTLQNSPEGIEGWIKAEMTADQKRRMRQTIRARRKRFFNAEKQSTRKKSIDLDYPSWQRLANVAESMELTLSEAIHLLIDEFEKMPPKAKNG
ncbi:macrodomain Ter protein [Pasteurellaceae bacterium Macca]|nr:macrodomain Ter protein [Pasteurellaceae bacterium Macca]